MILIIGKRTRLDAGICDEIHRLRYKVFHSRLKWDVDYSAGREVDDFDSDEAIYVAVVKSEQVVACARLISCSSRTMLSTTFRSLIDADTTEVSDHSIESSRFCVDTKNTANDGQLVTRLLISGMLRWCYSFGFRSIITVTDIRIERLLRRLGIPFQRLGSPQTIGNTRAIAGRVPVALPLADNVLPIAPTDYQLSARIDFPT